MGKFFLLATISIAVASCTVYTVYSEYGNHEVIATTRNRNVCTSLHDSVVVYPIFVDVDQFHPWTMYDISSTLDSINKAMKWIENQAKNSHATLSINVQQHKQKQKLSFNETKVKNKKVLLDLGYVESGKRKYATRIEAWANKIATHAAKAVKSKSESKIATKNKVDNVERFIARLRNIYKTDNVALMIFVNGYCENYPSVSLNTSFDGPEAEFSIITEKNPATIAHEFLHLFGAVDLYNHSFYNFNFKELAEIYPNEVMRITHKNVDSLMISPITKYYIGWQRGLDKPNTRLLYHKHNVLEY